MPSFGALETIPPFAIITAAVCVIGGLQGLIQNLAFGKPKAINIDPWDRKIVERDAKLKSHPESFIFTKQVFLRVQMLAPKTVEIKSPPSPPCRPQLARTLGRHSLFLFTRVWQQLSAWILDELYKPNPYVVQQ